MTEQAIRMPERQSTGWELMLESTARIESKVDEVCRSAERIENRMFGDVGGSGISEKREKPEGYFQQMRYYHDSIDECLNVLLDKLRRIEDGGE